MPVSAMISLLFLMHRECMSRDIEARENVCQFLQNQPDWRVADCLITWKRVIDRLGWASIGAAKWEWRF